MEKRPEEYTLGSRLNRMRYRDHVIVEKDAV